MIILGIETSCDETSSAVIKVDRGKIKILSNIVSSQIKIHKKYGGVVPEIAARHHVEDILPVIDQSLKTTKINPKDIDLIAVTAGPGLITSLIVGVETAKTLSYVWQKPLLAVNHMYAHLAGNFLEDIKFPSLALIVSGGHTELILLKNYHNYKKIGQTIDDAAGEAFDKVAKLLDLGYPGGPAISATAAQIPDSKFKIPDLKFPRPMIGSDNFNFSFSGLKTAVLYKVKKMKKSELKKRTPEICYEFQQAVIDVLITKTMEAAKKYQVKTVVLAGGVAANKELRETLQKRVQAQKLEFKVPEFKLCTDNAAMIAIAGYYLSQKQKISKDNWQKIKADPNWELR